VICCPESWVNLAARDELEAVVDLLGEDEVRVLVRIAARLLRGADIYGRLDVVRDSRDFRKEAREEIEDFLVYAACEHLRRQP
jgi:hypothetical protein